MQINPTLFNRGGHEAADGRGGVVYINTEEALIDFVNETDYSCYKKQITKIVKERFKNELHSNEWYYIYAFNGASFYPIVNSDARSKAFVGKNAPYIDAMSNLILCPPLSSCWQAIIPTDNFGRVEFSCSEVDLDTSLQYPDSSYPVNSRQEYFPSLLYFYIRGSTKSSYDSAIHLSSAFKILVVGSLNRSIWREDWQNKDVLKVLDKLYCTGSLI